MERPSSDLFIDDRQLKLSRLNPCQYFELKQYFFTSQLNAACLILEFYRRKKIGYTFIFIANFKRRLMSRLGL